MELLVVIAILGALAAIAAPSLAHIVRVTEMNRLDNYAKEIYIAVQDQLIGMESTGEYKQFNAALREGASQRNLGAIDAMPPDAPDALWRNFYYVSNRAPEATSGEMQADAALAELMGRTAIVEGLASGGVYIVELNPREDGTDVYSVFYSEDPLFSYADVRNLTSRERTSRQDAGRGWPVGYYNGFSTESAALPDHFSPRASFVNGEELFLNVRCAGGIGLVAAQNNIEMKVVLSDGTTSTALRYVGGQDFQLDAAGNIDLDITIDSLRDNMHLADIFPEFSPGADITATVEVEFNQDGVTISTPVQSRGQARANSLYAKNTNGALEVANVRHLSNLNLAPADTSSVVQVANIDFDASSWGSEERTQLSSATRSYNEITYGSEYVNPLDPNVVSGATGFSPLQTSGASWSYNGRGNLLSHFVIRGTGSVGFFAAVQAAQTVLETTLVDPIVQGNGPIGALCGELYGDIEKSGVRLDINSAAEEDKTSLYVVRADSGADCGGLVGVALGSASIRESYAAINVVAPTSSSVGGLVGHFGSTGSIQQSYASGEVDGAQVVGGLLGTLSSGNVEVCYSTSNVYSAVEAGGFIGEAIGGSCSSCVAYGRVTAADAASFVGIAGSSSFESCLALVQPGYNEALAEQPSGIEGQSYSVLANMRLASDHSHPYKASLLGEAFPFFNVLEEHWGNWPAPVNMNPLMLYYERYGLGSYGFYGAGQTPLSVVDINTLEDGLTIFEDGYALLSVYPIAGFEYSFNGLDMGRMTLGTTPGPDTFVELPNEGVVYWDGQRDDRMLDEMHIYQLPFDLQMPARSATAPFYDTLEITLAGEGGSAPITYTYYYNPDFAKLSSSPDIDGNTALPDTSSLLVRTPRQLYRLGVQEAYWNETIVQDRDIDYVHYTNDYIGTPIDLNDTTGAYASVPIGRAGNAFSGVYDGFNHTIIDYNQRVDSLAQTGLFGEITGTVKNVHLATSIFDASAVIREGFAPSGVTIGTGALAGWLNGGTISGCSVSGYSIYLNGSNSVSSASVGGLVGVNQGQVLESSAANVSVYLLAPSSADAALGVGGLVGGSEGIIERSYALENTLTCQTSTSSGARNIAYGGIAGLIYNGGTTISDCYGYCYAKDTICSTTDTVTHYDIANSASAYCTLFNCYRLSWQEIDDEGNDLGFSTGAQDTAEVIACTPAQLQQASLAGFAGSSIARNTYGDTMEGQVVQAASDYPYPVVCKDAYGEWAHYGFDWW